MNFTSIEQRIREIGLAEGRMSSPIRRYNVSELKVDRKEIIGLLETVEDKQKRGYVINSQADHAMLSFVRGKMRDKSSSFKKGTALKLERVIDDMKLGKRGQLTEGTTMHQPKQESSARPISPPPAPIPKEQTLEELQAIMQKDVLEQASKGDMADALTTPAQMIKNFFEDNTPDDLPDTVEQEADEMIQRAEAKYLELNIQRVANGFVFTAGQDIFVSSEKVCDIMPVFSQLIDQLKVMTA